MALVIASFFLRFLSNPFIFFVLQRLKKLWKKGSFANGAYLYCVAASGPITLPVVLYVVPSGMCVIILLPSTVVCA